ncbi:AAA family ATPase [Candidatus Woesearchaeota archaeon]|nr:AAA family ATPase [Candidatus Woesearchaeota archaeon]
MKKIVITGGHCVGKTTTINLIKEHGIHVIDEVPRDIIAAELWKQKNNPLYEPIVPWTKFEEFQHLIIDEQLRVTSLITATNMLLLQATKQTVLSMPHTDCQSTDTQ